MKKLSNNRFDICQILHRISRTKFKELAKEVVDIFTYEQCDFWYDQFRTILTETGARRRKNTSGALYSSYSSSRGFLIEAGIEIIRGRRSNSVCEEEGIRLYIASTWNESDSRIF